jgi:hypothetical protein
LIEILESCGLSANRFLTRRQRLPHSQILLQQLLSLVHDLCGCDLVVVRLKEVVLDDRGDTQNGRGDRCSSARIPFYLGLLRLSPEITGSRRKETARNGVTDLRRSCLA